jgi:hypothetical protein
LLWLVRSTRLPDSTRLSWLLNGETLNTFQLIGGALVVADIVCACLENPSRGALQADTGTTVIGAKALPLSTAAIPIITLAPRRLPNGDS